MITEEFAFVRPTELSEVFEALDVAGPDSRILAGGMSLLPLMNVGLAHPTALVSLNHVSGLSPVELRADGLYIGAMVRHHEVASQYLIQRHASALAVAAACIGDVQVRHRGTIGGSLAHADPSADYLTVLAAYDAKVIVESSRGARSIPVCDLTVGFMTTTLQVGEVIVGIEVPIRSGYVSSSYLRHAAVEGSFAVTNAVAVVTTESLTVAIGGIHPSPIVIAVSLPGDGEIDDIANSVSEELAEKTCDTGGTDLAEYKKALAPVYGRRVTREALSTHPGYSSVLSNTALRGQGKRR